MNLQSISGIAVLVLASSASGADIVQEDHRLTIPELVAAQAPQPLVQSRQRELLPQPLETLVPQANLVLRGRVESLNSYLSDDQRDVYTDYVIVPIRVFLHRPTISGEPSSGVPLVVRRWGGQITIQGVSVTAIDQDIDMFSPGQELILVLKYDGTSGKYQLIGPVSGAFAVIHDRIALLVRHPNYEKYDGLPAADVESEIRRLGDR